MKGYQRHNLDESGFQDYFDGGEETLIVPIWYAMDSKVYSVEMFEKINTHTVYEGSVCSIYWVLYMLSQLKSKWKSCKRT